MAALALDMQKGPGIAARAPLCGGDGGLAADDRAHIGIEAGGLGKQRLQLVAIDAVMDNQIFDIVIVQTPKTHLIGVAVVQSHSQAIGFALIFRQLHRQSTGIGYKIARAGHRQKAIAAKLLQDGLCYVHCLDLSKESGAAHSVEQRKAVDRCGAAFDGAHGAGDADSDDLGLFAGDIGIDRRNGVATVQIDQIAGADDVAAGIFLMRQFPVVAVDGQNILTKAEGCAAVNDFQTCAVVHVIGQHGSGLFCKKVSGHAQFMVEIDALVRAQVHQVGQHVAHLYAGKVNLFIFSPCEAHIFCAVGSVAIIAIHLRPFLTIAADYSSGSNHSYKAALLDMSSVGCIIFAERAGHGRKLPCQYIKYACSGHAVDAVRMHSAFSFLHAKDRAPARVDAPAFVSPLACFFVSLTPARFGAYRLVCQISALYGSGGAVLVGTVSEPWQNQQHIDFIAFSCSVLGFQPSRACYAHVRVRGCERVHAREEKPRTSELHEYIVIIHIDIGSSAVLKRFQPEPLVKSRAFPPISIKIVGGYVAASSFWASKGLERGGERDFFGLFCLGGVQLGDPVLDRIDLGGCAQLDEVKAQSDGFLRVPAARCGPVGMTMLECEGQAIELPCYSAMRPLPIGKGSAASGTGPADRPRHPPLPPFTSTPTPSSIARHAGQNLIGLRPLNHIGTKHCGFGRATRTGSAHTGSGEGNCRPTSPAKAGWGRKAAGKLRRFGQATGSVAHVN